MSCCNTSFSSVQKAVSQLFKILFLSAGLFSLPLSVFAANDNFQSLFNFQTKMAAQGSTEAMIKLGEMCEEGLGTEKSVERAKEWYQHALEKGHPDAQSHLDKLLRKEEMAAQDQAMREKAAKEQATREQAVREQAAREQAAHEQAVREQAASEQAALDKAAQEEAAKREAAKQAMTPEEKARAREEAIRRAEAAYQQSIEKQLEKEKADSEALKRSRNSAVKKK